MLVQKPTSISKLKPRRPTVTSLWRSYHRNKKQLEKAVHIITETNIRKEFRHTTMSVSKEDSVKVGLKDGRMHSVNSDDRARRGRCSTRAELLVLCSVTVVIWLLLLLPIIIYSQIPVVSCQHTSLCMHLCNLVSRPFFCDKYMYHKRVWARDSVESVVHTWYKPPLYSHESTVCVWVTGMPG